MLRSSGKDSAYALWEVARAGELEVVGLLTTVTRAFGRVSTLGVREALVERQAETAGLPLQKVELPSPCPNEVYERTMGGDARRAHARRRPPERVRRPLSRGCSRIP